LPYVQDYLRKYGVRKCEANAIVINPKQGRNLCRETIEKYLGTDAIRRFQRKKRKIAQIIDKFRKDTGLDITIYQAISLIKSKEKL